ASAQGWDSRLPTSTVGSEPIRCCALRRGGDHIARHVTLSDDSADVGPGGASPRTARDPTGNLSVPSPRSVVGLARFLSLPELFPPECLADVADAVRPPPQSIDLRAPPFSPIQVDRSMNYHHTLGC